MNYCNIKNVLVLMLVGFASTLNAGEYYTTENRIIAIVESHCEEGILSCDNVSAKSYLKKTGEISLLSGESFIGGAYKLNNSEVSYYIHHHGTVYIQEKNAAATEESWEYVRDLETNVFFVESEVISTHCKNDEYAYLNARLMKKVSSEGMDRFNRTNKLVSICSDRLVSPFSKVVYRFGEFGNVELEKIASVTKEFGVSTQSLGQNSRKNTFSFSIGKYTYQVADVIGSGAAIDEGVYLDVTKAGKNVVSFYSGGNVGKDFESGLIEIDFTQAKLPLYSVEENKNFVVKEAFSWGGVLRDEPSVHAHRIGLVAEKEPIVVLGKTSEKLYNYPWFKIRVGDKEGYHWGGIICDKAYADKTYCE